MAAIAMPSTNIAIAIPMSGCTSWHSTQERIPTIETTVTKKMKAVATNAKSLGLWLTLTHRLHTSSILAVVDPILLYMCLCVACICHP